MDDSDILSIFLVVMALVLLVRSYKAPLGIGAEILLIISGAALINSSISYLFYNDLNIIRILTIAIGACNVMYALVKIYRKKKHEAIKF
jgi:hypothetical protein